MTEKTYSKETEAKLAQMDPDRREKWKTNPMVQYIIESVIYNASANAQGGVVNSVPSQVSGADTKAPPVEKTPQNDGDDSSGSSVVIDGPMTLFGEDDGW